MRLLKLRAMLRLHDGDTAGAWRDIMALYRIGRLESSRSRSRSTWFCFGLLCDDMAGEAAVALSRQEGLTAAQAREFQKQLLTLPAMRSLGEFCNEGERCRSLETLTLLAAPNGPEDYFATEAMLDQMLKHTDPKLETRRGGAEKANGGIQEAGRHDDVDWTEVFRQYNLFQDRLAKVCGGAASNETVSAFEKLEAETAAEAKDTMDVVLSGDPSVVERMSRDLKAQHIAKLAILPGPLHGWGMYFRLEQKRQARATHDDAGLRPGRLSGRPSRVSQDTGGPCSRIYRCFAEGSVQRRRIALQVGKRRLSPLQRRRERQGRWRCSPRRSAQIRPATDKQESGTIFRFAPRRKGRNSRSVSTRGITKYTKSRERERTQRGKR